MRTAEIEVARQPQLYGFVDSVIVTFGLPKKDM